MVRTATGTVVTDASVRLEIIKSLGDHTRLARSTSLNMQHFH
jgi:hypothetical protein